MIAPIKPNETSFAVAQLHLVMQLLQLPVNKNEQEAKKAGFKTQETIKTWQEQQQLPISPDWLIDTATSAALSKALKSLGYLESDLRNSFSGKVVRESGDSIQKVTVWAFDLDLKGVGLYKNLKFAKELLAAKEGFEFLGAATSSKTGYFEVVYYDWMYAKSERRCADVVAFAIKGDDIIGRTVLQQNTARNTQDNRLVVPTIKSTKGEYKPLYKTLISYLEENSMSLTDIGQSQDYTNFIAGELELDLEKLNHLLFAHLLNDSTDQLMKSEFLYGLGRQKITLQWERLYRSSPEVLERALMDAIKEYDIDNFPQSDIDVFLDTLYTSASEKILQPQGNTPNIGDELLKLSLSKPKDRVLFAKVKAQYTGNDEVDFWENYMPQQLGFDSDTVQNLRTDQEIFGLSGFYLPMTKELKRTNLAPKQWVAWEADQWQEKVRISGVPERIDGANENEKIKKYAWELQKKVNTKYTTAAVQHKISTNAITYTNAKVRNALATFLETESDFDIKSAKLSEYEDTLKSLAGTQEANQKQTIIEALALQRMARCNPHATLIGTMKNLGLTSARIIAEFPKKVFMAEYGNLMGGEESTAELFYLSEEILAKLEVSLEVARSITGPKVEIIRNLSTSDDPTDSVSEEDIEATDSGSEEAIEARFPGYGEAFNVNLCECGHCNSVYSPAAYFVDLMRYLERGEKKPVVNEEEVTELKSPSDIFRERRPDLFHLPLTCENSNTLIPYIDLANEVMENYIYYTEGLSPEEETFKHYQSADTGDLTAEELRAQPQHIQAKTYIRLSEAIFPLTMPYHLPLETLRAYSEQMGTSWYEVLKTVQEPPVTDDIPTFLKATYLNLTEKDYEILTALEISGTRIEELLPDLFGVSSLADLAEVPTFLKQTGLQYTELIQLIKTNYINPDLYHISYLDFLFRYREVEDGDEIGLLATEVYAYLNTIASGGALPEIVERALEESEIDADEFIEWVGENFEGIKDVLTLYQEASECDLSTTYIRTIRDIYDPGSGAIPELVWRNLLRFIRLWRKTGWSIQDLDVVVSSLTTATFDADFIEGFFYAKEFIDTTGLTPKKAVLLWSDMDYRGEGNLYTELFLNRSLEINEIFVPLPNKDLFSGLDITHPLARYHADILAALKVSEEDLQLIYTHDTGISAENTISMTHISTLYRYFSFADLCAVSIKELLQLDTMFSLNLFSGPSAVWASYNKIKKIKATDFSMGSLADIFRIDGLGLSSLLPKDAHILENVIFLHGAYLKIDGRETDLASRLLLKKRATYEFLASEINGTAQVVEWMTETAVEACIAIIEAISIDDTTREIIDTTTLLDLTVPESPKNVIQELHRAYLTIANFRLTENEIGYLKDHNADFNALDFKDVSIAAWWRLYDYTYLKESLPETEKSPIDIFGYISNTAPGTTPDIDELKTLIVEVTNWKEADVAFLLTTVHIDLGAFKSEKPLVQLQQAVQLAKTMGLTVPSLYGLKIAPEDAFDDYWERAQKLKRLLKAKYDQSTWTSVATKLNDTLREQRRDALVAYLLQMETIKNPELGIGDANGLYEFFLLDVQMSACMETSRMVQASAAIQQFVNRSHLNLEKHVKVDALVRNRWAWMKQYRVWEAQMRVWYENATLLNPAWRMDKSPFFGELESYLTQNDITDRTAEEAIRGYLKSMDEVSNLNVAGMYEETLSSEMGGGKIVHVFGHANNTPYTYYYRTYDQYGKWSAWEKVDAAIQAVTHSDADTGDGEQKTGVHLIPVVWKNRLILFWPEFLEKTETQETVSGTFRQIADSRTPEALEPKKYWEVRLAWSEYYDKKWTAKQISEEFIRLNEELPIFGNIGLNQVSFNSRENEYDGSLEIFMVPFHPTNENNDYVDFEYNPFKIGNLSNKIVVGFMFSTSVRSSRFTYNDELKQKYYVNSFMKTNKMVEIELAFSSNYLSLETLHQLIFPNQLQYNDDPVSYPFFYSVEGKNYFVKQINVHEDITIYEGLGEGSLGPGSGFDFVEPIQRPYLSFSSFHHPFVSDFISNLNKNGIGTHDWEKPGLMESDTLTETTDGRSYDDGGSGFDEFLPNWFTVFKPTDVADPKKTYFKETIDFDHNGANSIYNWELFYHTPLYIATQLSKNGKFKEAVKWLHYMFDPTTDEVSALGADEIARFFKVKPFKTTDPNGFETFIEGLARDGAGGAENTIVTAWRNNPFNPHLVASYFPANYMKYVVLAYVENLVAWGDSLFRKFTRENVYEALQLYVIAGHIMGPRPQFVPKPGVRRTETYETIRGKLNDLGNAYGVWENNIPYSSRPATPSGGERPSSILGIGSAFYFCIPPNERLFRYWDIVEDRLFKIRHCKDIKGVARRLALFAPRIDPAALIAAKSAGISLEDILDGLYAPSPHYRFSFLLQKANEFCNDVKSLGSAILSAIEKQEGEELSRLRTTHEVEMLGMVQKIKERQLLDARTAKELLENQRETAIFRFEYYNETLLGNEAVEIPLVNELAAELDENSQITVNPDIQEVVPDVSVALEESGETGVKLISKESTDIDLRKTANTLSVIASGGELVASIAALFPEMETESQPFGVGFGVAFGGQNIAYGAQMAAKALHATSSVLNQEAAMASTFASYIRREQDWTLQANLAAKEIQQLERQILSAGIRVQITEKELENHKRQIENAERIEAYLKNKFSGVELYSWMEGHLKSLHKQTFDLAFQMAKQAVMAFEFEKGPIEETYISYDYWDNGKYGLLAGEKLQHALRQVEIAYLEMNVRQFELTKHISLQMLDPVALLMLKETGQCSYNLFEELFDGDYCSHWNRRIKSVSVSIPCVAGPYTTIPCTLRLTSNKIRISTEGASYPDSDPDGTSDSRFITQKIPVEAIATSSAQNDSGVYELNFRDERYIPFEGSGVISNWDLELFHTEAADYGKPFRQFDYNTITDVIMHIKFTAQEEDQRTFKDNAIANLATFFGGGSGNTLLKVFNLKHDFPSEWHNLQIGTGPAAENSMELKLTPNHFPFIDKSKNLVVNEIMLVAGFAKDVEANDFEISLITPEESIDDSDWDKSSLGQLAQRTKNSLDISLNLSTTAIINWSLNITKSGGGLLENDELNEINMFLGYNWRS